MPLQKSPWLAVNLSAVLPGLGQIYDGAVSRGVGIAAAHLGLLVFMGWSVFAPQGNTLRGLMTLIPFTALYLFNLWDSHHAARRLQTLDQVSPLRYRPTDPWYPVALSQVLPGLGQLFLQQIWVAGALLLAAISITSLANFHPWLIPLPPLIWALGCGLTYTSASRRPRQGKWLAGLLVALVAVRLLIGLTPVLVQQQVEQCIVPSESMVPTLEVNDRIFVRKRPNYQPQRGDIVVFSNPDKAPPSGVLLDPTVADLVVKRVIGLPGQWVEVRDGLVWVDGFALAEPYIAEPPLYFWGPQQVPPDHLFVLGDNRNYSRDSHIWGFIPQATVLGRAYKIYWPPQRIQPLIGP
ncbi:MAG: signal peptidase I [Spirulina sp.]